MDRYLIPSVNHACEIMRLLADKQDGLTSHQIESYLSLPRTTVFRLLKTLLNQQMLSKNKKYYFCGSELVNVGLQVLNSDRIHQIAIPFVQRLALQTKHTAHLAVPNNGSSLIVEVADSPNPLRVASRPGLRAQMHCSSTGKVFLAHLFLDDLVLVLGDEPWQKRTEQSITGLADLREELKKVLAQGYALDDREYHDNVRCLAAPIRDSRGRVVAAIGITGPANVFTRAKIPEIASYVKKAAASIYQQVFELDKVNGVK